MNNYCKYTESRFRSLFRIMFNYFPFPSSNDELPNRIGEGNGHTGKHIYMFLNYIEFTIPSDIIAMLIS
jgi:hypothetical protein